MPLTQESQIEAAAPRPPFDARLTSFWRAVETGIYFAVACVIAVTALMALAACCAALWQGLRNWNSWEPMLRVIDSLMLVLMLVEILHTVRMSIHSHVMVAEPFLIVGLIATIRRILVIGLEAGNLSRPETWSAANESMFRASVTELALLAMLVLVLVIAIYLVRRTKPSPEPTS